MSYEPDPAVILRTRRSWLALFNAEGQSVTRLIDHAAEAYAYQKAEADFRRDLHAAEHGSRSAARRLERREA